MRKKTLDAMRAERDGMRTAHDCLLAMVKRAKRIAVPLAALQDLHAGDTISVTVHEDGVLLEFAVEGDPRAEQEEGGEVVPFRREEPTRPDVSKTHDLRSEACANGHPESAGECSCKGIILGPCRVCGEKLAPSGQLCPARAST